MAKHRLGLLCFLLALSLILLPAAANAGQAPAPSQGGGIFVPAYSEILIGDNARPFLLSVTLCLRNTSPNEEVTVLSVDYLDSAGKLLKKYVPAPQTMKALGSLTFTVAESDKHGGPGAKFIVTWKSARPVSPPLAEAVMIGTSGQQGISFASRGEAWPAQP